MRTIYKTISLEQFKSRMPSIIPAYDIEGNKYVFSHKIDLIIEPFTNYNMIPFNVIVEGGDYYDLGEYNGKEYSYYELVNIFHRLDKQFTSKQIEKCNSPLNYSEIDKNMYKWLLDFCFPFFIFDIQLENKINFNEIKTIKAFWGADRLSINEIAYWVKKMSDLKISTNCCDVLEYEKRGGDLLLQILTEWYYNKINTIICEGSDYGHDYQYSVYDTDTVVTVKVLRFLKNGNQCIQKHTFQIYEPKIKILGNNRYITYGFLNENGELVQTENIEIINGILTIPCLVPPKVKAIITNEPFFTIPISLNNKMINLGEMSSLCDEWEGGNEYTTKGSLVFYNNDYWVLNGNFPGYMYSNTYKEIYFGNVKGMTTDEKYRYYDENNFLKNGYKNEEQWVNYFSSFQNIIDKTINNYAYKNNLLILNPNADLMSDEYKINTNNGYGFCLYGNKLFTLLKCDFVLYNQTKYQVFYEKKLNGDDFKPYIYFRKRKKKGILNKNGEYVFYFNDYERQNCSPLKEYLINKQKNELFFSHLDVLFSVNDGELIDGIVEIDNEILYCKKHNNLFQIYSQHDLGEYVNYELFITKNNSFQGYTSYKKNIDFYIKCIKPYILYNSNIISGTTSSRVEELMDYKNMAYDDLGYKLSGLLPWKEITINEDITYYDYSNISSSNDWLSIPYVPKIVFNLDIEDGKDYGCGNIIEQITISYNLLTTNEAITIKCFTNEELKNVERVMRNEYEKNNISNIKCEVEYYIGTLINIEDKNGEIKYSLKYSDNNEYYGIKYISYFDIVPNQCLYNIDDVNSYLVNFWDLKHENILYQNNDYNVKNLKENISHFEFLIKPFKFEYGFIEKNNNNTTFYKVDEKSTYVMFQNNKYQIYFDNATRFLIINNVKHILQYYLLVNAEQENYLDFDMFNNMSITPLFRNENMLFQATNENIKANIYIDRGSSRAIDFHLRLMEAKSLESLEQIGNGFFNIKKNNE